MERPDRDNGGPPFDDSAARLGLTPTQGGALLATTIALIAALVLAPGRTAFVLVVAAQILFLAVAAWRGLLILFGLRETPAAPEPAVWPRYTVLAALHDEADVIPQLVRNLSALDYPADRLEGWLVLEAHDHATIEAAQRAARPDWLGVHVVPPGPTTTKPRALNHALRRAGGELLTIYDAEDQPDPGQLKAAAARFVADDRIGCLQASLRIRRHGPSPSRFIDRQFAVEYAALFEVALPGLARLGLPFPLGGTSNHLRVAALRETGGWDPCNVTEDADLGFRLWRNGWRLGVVRSPTWETPPAGLSAWLPQRTRWLKGYMQTLGVHTRRLDGLGWRGGLALFMTLAVSLLSAFVHAPAIAWVLAALATAAVAGFTPATPVWAMAVLIVGALSAWITGIVGARRAGVPYGPLEIARSPAYWAMLSLAAFHAAWRLATQPHYWDKTPHTADDAPALDAAPGERLSATHAARPQP